MRKLKICILGSSGQIGSDLSDYLTVCGHTVTTFDIKKSYDEDLRLHNSEKLAKVISKNDFCFFLAFDVGGSKYLSLNQNSYVFIDNNLRIMSNVFTLLDKFKKPFVFASSQMSTMMHSNYGLLKLIGERATESLNGLTVSFWNIYGNETDENKFHVITDFIRMAHNNKEIKMQTNGEEIRDFLYVKDCSKALKSILENYENLIIKKNIHVASFKWVKIIEVARMVSTLTAAKITPSTKSDNIQIGFYREPDPYILNYWQPEVDIFQGISEIYSNYAGNNKLGSKF
jgi:nucleoside-diphosphate-sugar epimerase